MLVPRRVTASTSPESSTIYISKPFAEQAGEDDSMVAKKAT